jgi:hypothetical protein
MRTVVKCLVPCAFLFIASCAAAQNPPKPGDAVWAEWQPNAWFPGKLAKLDGRKCFIAFDDGDKAIVDMSKVAVDRVPSRDAVKVNTRVLAKFTDGHFYPGKIAAIGPDQEYAIQYDDGDTLKVPLADLRLISK